MHNAFFTCGDKLTRYYRLAPCFVGERALSTFSIAKLFCENVVRFFGILAEKILDTDPRFTAFFLLGAVDSAGDQESDEFCLPSSDR